MEMDEKAAKARASASKNTYVWEKLASGEADDGSVEEIPTAYANGTLVMTLSHFSEYVVVNTAVKDATNPSTGDSFSPIMMVCLLVMSSAALIVLSGKKRFVK